MSKYRIKEKHGQVWIQRSFRFLWWTCWEYTAWQGGSDDNPPTPYDYKTVEAAKKQIDELLIQDPKCSVTRTTNYPS